MWMPSVNWVVPSSCQDMESNFRKLFDRAKFLKIEISITLLIWSGFELKLHERFCGNNYLKFKIHQHIMWSQLENNLTIQWTMDRTWIQKWGSFLKSRFSRMWQFVLGHHERRLIKSVNNSDDLRVNIRECFVKFQGKHIRKCPEEYGGKLNLCEEWSVAYR